MAGPVTKNFGIQLPEVNSDANVWGGILNGALGQSGGVLGTTDFDQVMQDNADAAAAAAATANAALPVDGSAPMTGRLDQQTGTVKEQSLTPPFGAILLDLAVANFFVITPPTGGTLTIDFENAPVVTDGIIITFVSILPATPTSIAWGPTSTFLWTGGVDPVLSPLGQDLIGLWSQDDGATWYGSLAQRDVR